MNNNDKCKAGYSYGFAMQSLFICVGFVLRAAIILCLIYTVK